MSVPDNIIEELLAAGIEMNEIITGSNTIQSIDSYEVELAEAILASELEYKAKISESTAQDTKYEAELAIAIMESNVQDTTYEAEQDIPTVKPNFTEACLAFFRGERIILSERITNFAKKAVELGYDKKESEKAATIAGNQLAKMVIEDRMYPYFTDIEHVIFDQEHETYIQNGFMFFLKAFFFGNYNYNN